MSPFGDFLPQKKTKGEEPLHHELLAHLPKKT
jgi:hypothetical protein